VDTTGWVNVCIRCGSGSAEDVLKPLGALPGLRVYRCPRCGAKNPFFAA
jgi:ribosomal protein L40E